ncbi:hypothetical protein MCAP1_002130 [Malassezia caprae]|uniref:Uncharacterized protein n=1 Tax=Malassezia caprae TaxID=1381934 RepID=A0AAF0E7P6_9BASI|nr:hypothetical protein MCAP1_002130 [Malassezia caprae]
MSTSAVARKDLVQEAYLRELKAYKAPPKDVNAHKGQVREFSAPAAPSAPSAPSSSEISSELEAYAAAEPDAVPVSHAADEAVTEQQDVNEYLKELQADLPAEPHH